MNKKIKDFWDKIIRNEDGTINEKQLYKELSDFSFVMDNVSEVYSHITWGRMSYITYEAKTIIDMVEHYWIEKDIAMSDVLDLLKYHKWEELKKEIEEYFSTDY